MIHPITFRSSPRIISMFQYSGVNFSIHFIMARPASFWKKAKNFFS